MDAVELVKRLREVGAQADIIAADDGIRIPVDLGVTLLDFLLSAAGTEQASAIVTKLADGDYERDDGGGCHFCGRAWRKQGHAGVCLWQLARQWKETWG
jgi:hypothetical protein